MLSLIIYILKLLELCNYIKGKIELISKEKSSEK